VTDAITDHRASRSCGIYSSLWCPRVRRRRTAGVGRAPYRRV